MVFCPEHPKRDQSLKFIPLSETTSIPPLLYAEYPPRGIFLAPVVQEVDNAIHWINYYPLDSPIGFPNTCPLDSDLSGV